MSCEGKLCLLPSNKILKDRIELYTFMQKSKTKLHSTLFISNSSRNVVKVLKYLLVIKI